jgi:hypothetical protein
MSTTRQTSEINLCFRGTRPATISIHSYLNRIYNYAKCSYYTVVTCLVFFYRLLESNEIDIDFMSIHRILITCFMLADKFTDDNHHSNLFFAMVGGISLKEINQMEVKVLFILDFNFVVTPAEFNTHLDMILDFSPKFYDSFRTCAISNAASTNSGI